jgi:hypothetical protein
MLMDRPQRPRVQRDWGRGIAWGESRRVVTQAIEITYVPISATVERESMALKAAVLPMLIREIIIVNIMVKMIELTGTRHFSWTCK